MPGLKELSHFRDELSKLANERKVVAERGEVYEDLPLPPSVSASAPQLDVDDLLASLGETVPPPEETNAADLSGFDDLLSSLSLDEHEAEPAAVSGADAVPESDEDSFGVPEDLLAGFAADIEQTRTEQDSFALPDFEMPEISDIPETTESLETFEIPEISDIPETPEPLETFEIPEVSDIPETPEPLDTFEIPEIQEISEITDLEEFSEPETLEEFSDDGAEIEQVAGKSDDELLELDEMDFTPSFELDEGPKKPAVEKREEISMLDELTETDVFSDENSEPTENAALPGNDDFTDFVVPDDLNIVETESNEPAVSDLDGFDGFSLDADFLKASAENAASDSDEFHIPGFSDFTSGEARPSLSEFPETGGTPRKSTKKEIPLKITEEDFEKFLEILATYPLNLRIAIEEYLSGATGTEVHKMGLVQSIIAQTPLRKIAHILETALDRSIPIPKDYEKKTLADYEREKSSLKYVFLNRILPAAIIFIITATLAACTVYLSYQFIYRPLAAESLYKRGYAAIEDQRYSQSIVLFDEAVRMWEKKKWYFTYAQGYKEKKQYLSAEMMYIRLLDRFKNDKNAGLEYAEMLRTDLRNYAKAEEILKRRLLDFYVNDKDGLMLLGDNYLDWAEEDPAKFEEARKTYAILIELYGSEDPYLARMMRYFIRTDNLIQVLPLKTHFMNKKTKIGAQDLVELSGYLLEKRYNPGPGDSEYLQNQIEDLRVLLTRALKADDKSPEAHYNMGRFFIFNYKNDFASTALSESLLRFDAVSTMSPKRVLTHIDAFRLLGEVLAANKEYLRAQGLYTQGITIYEEQKANRAVRPDPRVGKLYADYADIDYFISGDLERALMNYTKATQELNNDASVRYRIGYIKYQKQDFENAMQIFMKIQTETTADKNLLYSFGNTLYRRGDFYAAQGYYEKLMTMLDAERLRKGVVFPQVRPDHQAFVTEYLNTSNNLGVTLGRLASRTGDSRKNARSLALLAESMRAWDALTRNQQSMTRLEGTNLAFLNIQNMTHPKPSFVPEIYADISKTLENEKILQQRADQ